MQKGSIVRVGNCWMLRYYEPVVENGRVIKKQKTKKLNPKSNHEKDVRAAADLILAPINAQATQPESRLELGTFLEHVFLPYVKEKAAIYIQQLPPVLVLAGFAHQRVGIARGTYIGY